MNALCSLSVGVIVQENGPHGYPRLHYLSDQQPWEGPEILHMISAIPRLHRLVDLQDWKEDGFKERLRCRDVASSSPSAVTAIPAPKTPGPRMPLHVRRCPGRFLTTFRVASLGVH